MSGRGTTGGNTTPKRYPVFDWVRLFLALSVMVFLHWPDVSKLPVPWTIRLNPFNAVPTFVFLSGFMALQSLDSSKGMVHFWWKRILRIFPALIISLFIVWEVMGPASAVASVQTYLSGGNARTATAANWPLWSLAYEEVGYLLLCVGHAFGFYRRSFSVLTGLLIASVLALLPTTSQILSKGQLLLPAFLLGSLLKLNIAKAEAMAKSWHILPLWAIAVLLAYMKPSPLVNLLHALVGCLVAALLGLAFRKVPPPKWDLSYSLYLLHMPALVLCRSFGFDSLPLLVCALICLAFWCPLVYVLIERPMLGFKNCHPPSCLLRRS